MKFLYTLFLVFLFNICFSQENYYPGARRGFTRVNVNLPKNANEKKYKVEFYLTINKEMEDCHTAKMENKFQKKTYGSNSYYEASSDYQILTYSNEKCGGKKMSKKVYNEPVTEKYQSKDSFVFYIPENMAVEYRLLKDESGLSKVN